MSSLLIHGGTKESRKDKALGVTAKEGIDPQHVQIIDEKKMGIDIIKEMIAKAHVRSQGSGEKAVVIPEAQRLTKPAQNALLKTLEEPPAHLTIILTAPSPKLLLPTIVSRCMKETPEREETPGEGGKTREVFLEETSGVYGFIKNLLAAPPCKRLAMFEEEIGYDKDEVFEFFDEVEGYFKNQFLPTPPIPPSPPSPKKLQFRGEARKKVCEPPGEQLLHLWRSKKLLHDETANVKLVVDEWLLSW